MGHTINLTPILPSTQALQSFIKKPNHPLACCLLPPLDNQRGLTSYIRRQRRNLPYGWGSGINDNGSFSSVGNYVSLKADHDINTITVAATQQLSLLDIADPFKTTVASDIATYGSVLFSTARLHPDSNGIIWDLITSWSGIKSVIPAHPKSEFRRSSSQTVRTSQSARSPSPVIRVMYSGKVKLNGFRIGAGALIVGERAIIEAVQRPASTRCVYLELSV